MKYLFCLLLFSTTSSWGAVNMKPGLWSLDTKISTGGKEIDPSAQMREAMAKMPEAQRNKIMGMLGKNGKMRLGQTGDTQVCYSKKLIENPTNFENNQNQKCSTKLIVNTKKKIVSAFKCTNGSSGEGSWNFDSEKSMSGVVKMKDASGKTSQIKYQGKFLKADCGQVAPIL